MLNRLDDYLVHQTPEPLAHPATTDRNFYDRFWFNGYLASGEWYFGVALGLYPHRGVMDGAFSVVRQGGQQRSFYASRRAPAERTDQAIGPFRIETIEPMRRTRVVLEANDSGLACDLVFTARTAAIQEARQVLWTGAKRMMDATRFDVFGRWSGWVETPEGRIVVDEETCLGTKDRSWGVRPVGEPEAGAPRDPKGGIFFLWAPLFWDDHVTQAIVFDDTAGRPLVREGIVAPLYAGVPNGPEVEDGQDRRMGAVRHRVDYQPGTRLARSAEIDLIEHDGATRTLTFEPLLRFQMKGIGYGHPKWAHGVWHGELATGHESWDQASLNLADPTNFHVQQVCRVTDGARTGAGVLEQIALGPYAPAGFEGPIDGAK